MLPTVQYLLMAIYCTILSAQHISHSMSVSVCQVGLRRTAPLKQTEQQRRQFIPNVHNVHHTPRGQQYDAPVGATVCISVSVCVNMCVCAFPLPLFVHSLC